MNHTKKKHRLQRLTHSSQGSSPQAPEPGATEPRELRPGL